MRRVVVPRASGVLSALGLVVSERRRDLVESVLLTGDELTTRGDRRRRGSGWPSAAASELGDRRRRSCARPTTCATPARRSSSRSRASPAPDPDELRSAFDARPRGALRLLGPERRARAGHDPGQRGAAGRPTLPGAAGAPAEERGPARPCSAGERVEAAVLAAAPRARRARRSSSCPRPTLVVPPGWRGAADADGTCCWSARVTGPGHAPGDGRRAARGLRRDGRRAGALGALGEHQGAPRRLHRACSTPSGEMVMQAEHIPVHLGAMPLGRGRGARRGATRRATPWVLNDPYRGGTHLPDITVISPRLRTARELIGFAASRAHHADVGGARAGQHARRLAHARGGGRRDPAAPGS